MESSTALVIDDQPVVRHTLSLCLNNLGIGQVVQAQDGQEAKSKYVDYEFDVIFCDLDMPVEDGFEVLRFLGEQEYQGSVIIISSQEQEVLASTSNLARLYDLNIIGCVEKPITFPTVQCLFNTIQKRASKKSTTKNLPVLSESDLQAALQHGRLEAYYQPQLSLSSKKVKGLEILARLFDHDGTLIFPDRFIPTAEQSHTLILTMTKQIIESALQEISNLFEHLSTLTFAFNISGKVLEDRDFPKWLNRIASQYQIPHEQIVCELTETAISTDQTTIDAQMLRLRIMRFKLSIDDFGTGYSSIAKLHTIPFNELKIDKSFVVDCLSNTKSAAIVQQSIKMAKAMDIEVVAEGVETEDVEAFLIGSGCGIGQGYLYAKPMPLDSVIELIKQGRNHKEKSE
ncbi:EAL domain-containing response regulator [Vibrio sp. MarTm2]|uniref:EAL domain-containing response regulator n=1 Tax=Vibrio sp. MarTm2 TaxID=2998831 RepID=UPI0022CDB61E|nr:EAL domain-containing response regulator [Vibrio sp. MarTm2]MDA0129268.1 EAL domain-containing response regulator [Vibrio sp. MarTm2]